MASQTGRPQHTFINSPQYCRCVQDTSSAFCLYYSKIQKYSPTESAKVYDKAVNRKSKVHFHPRQTLDFLKSNLSNTVLSYESKRNIVRQYLDVSFHHHAFHHSECFVYLCVILISAFVVDKICAFTRSHAE